MASVRTTCGSSEESTGWEREEGLVLRYRGPTGDPANDFQHDPMESEGVSFTTVWGSSADDMWLAATGIVATPQGARVYHGRGDGNGGTAFESVEVDTGFGSRGLFEVVGGIHVPETFIAGKQLVDSGPRLVGRDPSARRRCRSGHVGRRGLRLLRARHLRHLEERHLARRRRRAHPSLRRNDLVPLARQRRQVPFREEPQRHLGRTEQEGHLDCR